MAGENNRVVISLLCKLLPAAARGKIVGKIYG